MSTPGSPSAVPSGTTASDYSNHSGKRLEKLVDDGTSNSYGSWVGVAKSKLKMLRLWKYIEGPESIAPVIPPLVLETRIQATDEQTKQPRWFIQEGNEADVLAKTKAAEPWAEGNLTARTILLEALPSEKRSLISDEDSAKAIWDFLAEEYRPLNFTRTQVQFQNIMKFTCEPGMDVSKWAEQLRKLYVDLRSHDPNRIKDTDFAVTIANLLPATPDWSDFGGRLFEDLVSAHANNAPLSSARVFSMIRNHDWNTKKKDASTMAEVYNTEALYPKRPGSPSVNYSATPAKKSKKADDGNVPTCENKKCPRPIGHRTADCFAEGGAKAGQYPEWWRGKRDLHLPASQRKPAASRNQQKVFNNAKPRANAATAVEKCTHCHDHDDGGSEADVEAAVALSQEGDLYAFNIIAEPDPDLSITCNTAALVSENKQNQNVFHDSGANRHIFYDRSVFSNYKEIIPLHVKGFGSALSTSAVGKGDVYLKSVVNGRTCTIKLSDALHVPSARLNLVSQGCLDRRGVESASKGGHLTLSFDGDDIMKGQLQTNHLYRLHVQPISRELATRISGTPLLDRITPAHGSLLDRITPRSANAMTTSTTKAPKKGRAVKQGFYTA